MINGTEGEIPKPSISSQTTNNKNQSSSIPQMTTSSHSRSNSPCKSDSNHHTTNSGTSQHSNGTVHSSSRRSSIANNESSQGRTCYFISLKLILFIF